MLCLCERQVVVLQNKEKMMAAGIMLPSVQVKPLDLGALSEKTVEELCHYYPLIDKKDDNGSWALNMIRLELIARHDAMDETGRKKLVETCLGILGYNEEFKEWAQTGLVNKNVVNMISFYGDPWPDE